MRAILVVLTGLTLIATPAVAQPPQAVPLTLAQALERAVAESQRLAEAAARAEGARAAIRTRQAAAQPAVVVAGGYTRTNHVDEFGVAQPGGQLRIIYPDIPDNYFARASLHWPIYTAGRVDALVDAAEAEARASDADLEAARADLRLEVARAYWALVTATESVRVLDESLARADAHLTDVRSRLDAGFLSPHEVARVEAERARQAMHLIEARNLRESVVEDLRRLTGIDADIAAAEPLDAPGDAASNAAAARLRPEQQALGERIEAADARLRAIEASRHPTISFVGSADYANPNPRIFPRADVWRTSWEVGVQASWTVWDGGRAQAEAGEAAAAGRALRARRAEVDRQIASEVRQRELDLASARAALTAAQAAVTSAAEARRVVAERFAVGVATSTDVLDADVALLQASLDRTRALANIRLAEARRDRALGR